MHHTRHETYSMNAACATERVTNYNIVHLTTTFFYLLYNFKRDKKLIENYIYHHRIVAPIRGFRVFFRRVIIQN